MPENHLHSAEAQRTNLLSALDRIRRELLAQEDSIAKLRALIADTPVQALTASPISAAVIRDLLSHNQGVDRSATESALYAAAAFDYAAAQVTR